MDSTTQSSGCDQGAGFPNGSLSQSDRAGNSMPRVRDRRREKPQLSCNFCRRRKIRCDRQLPCRTCVDKGLALECAYISAPSAKQESKLTVGERMKQLEAMVRSLLQQQHASPQQPTPQTPVAPLDTSFTGSSPSNLFGATPDPSLQHVSVGAQKPTTMVAQFVKDTGPCSPTSIHAPPPTNTEHGSLRNYAHGAGYVNHVHWAAVLDSISELKDQYEKEKEEDEGDDTTTTDDNHMLTNSLGPRLLYEPVQTTKTDILASIPARPVVDRMVARYLNLQGGGLAVLHSGQFLRQYETFWKDPEAESFAWIGLLCSIMCLSTQHQQSIHDRPSPDTLARIHAFRELTVQCLVLSQYTKGGPHVLETMVHYCASELLLRKDADIGVWTLHGTVVQLALSRGYHRDPANFSNLSPFDGEMRRRLWAFVKQIDLRLSSQMGLPRLLKSHQCDTTDPRNLLDTDFDEEITELPQSRPETEITPVLYGLAKSRIDVVGGQISDLIADTHECLYSDIMELDLKIHEAEVSLPPLFRWQPLSQSFMVPQQVLLHRIWLQIALQRLKILLHRKYLAPAYKEVEYGHSRQVCVQAATRILMLQRVLDEETQPDGQLYPVPWVLSSLLQSAFLLGMSVLCYYVQLAKSTPEVRLGDDTNVQIKSLLHSAYSLWLTSTAVSREAKEAVERLSILLGMREMQESTAGARGSDSRFVGPQEAAGSFDQIPWDAYQECIANFPFASGTEFIGSGDPWLLMDPIDPGAIDIEEVNAAGLFIT